jgi:imidazolonepropionase-like amidohydrolase
MAEKNTYLVATISAGKHVAKLAKIKGYLPEIIVPKALAIGPQHQANFRKAYEKGVPIAFGTDAGVFPHGENAQEFEYMVEAGVPELKALQSATVTNAKILGLETEIGQLKPKFQADIIAVNTNPLKDIGTLKTVPFVMKAGVVYKQE